MRKILTGRVLSALMLIVLLDAVCFSTASAQGSPEIWERVVGNGSGGGNGFGDIDNMGAWSMAVFGSYLYVGTQNELDGCELWRSSDGTSWNQVTPDGFGDADNVIAWSMAVFDSYLYVGTSNGSDGCEVWRSNTGGLFFQVNTNGFGDASNTSLYSMAVFGSYLYVGTYNEANGCEVWRSSDGTSWTQVNTDGFGDEDNVSAMSMAVFDGYLYVGTQNTPDGCELWRSGNGTNWTQVYPNGFGNPAIDVAWSMAVFGSYLYVGTVPETEVWRSSDGNSWTMVNTQGFGDSYTAGAFSMVAFDNHLYVGTFNPLPISNGCKVWGSSDGTRWTQVNTDGFGDTSNFAALSMIVFDDYLYVGTDNAGCEVWRSQNPYIIPTVGLYYWIWRDIHQFQDNFSTDGTITGTARIDMAQDILSIANPAILPGDSAVITVYDPVYGLAGDAITGWGPAVYCCVGVWPQGQLSKTGASIQSAEMRNWNLRWPYVGDVMIDGDTWHRFRMDTCFASGGEPVPGRYCIDLNDNLFVPGDTVCFFYDAMNNYGLTEYLSAHESRNGPFATRDISIAANFADECTILPSAGLTEGNDILYVDGMNFNDAQWAFDWSFKSMNMYDKVDRFDIRGPGSEAVGNHPGSRVSNVIVQLSGVYRKIIWDCGDVQTAFGDGSGAPDKSDDTGMLKEFLDNLPNTGGELRSGGVYLDGDDVAELWSQFTSASATALRLSYLNHTVTNPDHVAAGLGFYPLVVGTDGFAELMAVTDTLLAYGGGYLISDFDVLAPTGAAILEANYVSNTGFPTTGGAIVSQTTANPEDALVGFLLSGFSFHHIRDRDHDGILDRWQHLRDILLWLNNYPEPPVSTGPNVRQNSLAQNYPNPFNPTTTIKYSIKERARVTLKVYNVAGQLVKTLVDEVQTPQAVKPITWDGRNNAGQSIASGVYFYRLVTKDFTMTKKLVLLK